MEYAIIGILIIIIAVLSIKRRKDFLEEKHTKHLEIFIKHEKKVEQEKVICYNEKIVT